MKPNRNFTFSLRWETLAEAIPSGFWLIIRGDEMELSGKTAFSLYIFTECYSSFQVRHWAKKDSAYQNSFSLCTYTMHPLFHYLPISKRMLALVDPASEQWPTPDQKMLLKCFFSCCNYIKFCGTLAKVSKSTIKASTHSIPSITTSAFFKPCFFLQLLFNTNFDAEW